MRWSRLRPSVAGLLRHGDLLLAALVVSIVAMMIVPLPTFLLDILITTNISLAVVLLLVSIYVIDALRIATFPTILLITTLFRLGLNVSSTRLILLQADAGEVISSFGNFVVAGNLVVGAVVFLILTLIQFIVIAKGSERVAEVAARFALDAMPGKQMAVDAELRAGTIDGDQARRQRALLQRESQFYGAMDGAMKFVKGDAVAGILITLVNILGGLAIGVLQRGMSLADAGHLYTLLTVGDGLVSQIPALLISTAAGIVVTRVAAEDEGSHLGHDMGAQLLAQPRAIAIAAGLLALLGLVPGLPAAPFLLLGGTAGAVAWGLRARATAADGGRAHPSAAPWLGSPPRRESGELPEPYSRLALEVGPALLPFVDANGEGRRLVVELIPGLRELLRSELGLPVPGVHVRRGRELRGAQYRFALDETPIAAGEAVLEGLVVAADAARLAAAGLPAGRPLTLPGLTGPASCLPPGVVLPAAAALDVVDPATQLVLHLGQVLRQQAAELVGIQETQELLDGLEHSHPALVHEVVPKLVSLPMLAEILRRLLDEQLPIRDLRTILHAMAEWAVSERDPLVLSEYARMGLRRYISHRYAGGSRGTLRAYLLDPLIEDAVRGAVQRTDKGSYLALEPALAREIVAAVGRELAGVPADEPLPVLLTNVEVRRFVRRLLETDFPALPVLAFGELLPSVNVQPVARVAL
jgi:type III secretion protein V